jgi:hypothetical protein
VKARRHIGPGHALTMEMFMKYEPMSGLWLVDHIGDDAYCHIAKVLGYFDPMLVSPNYRPPLQVPRIAMKETYG